MKYIAFLLVILAALGILAPLASGQLYKWIIVSTSRSLWWAMTVSACVAGSAIIFNLLK